MKELQDMEERMIELSDSYEMLKIKYNKLKDKQMFTVGEYYWYGYELVQVIDVTDNHIKIVRQDSECYDEVDMEQLEPFRGELPTFIKDKK